jgi:hypothetical protein
MGSPEPLYQELTTHYLEHHTLTKPAIVFFQELSKIKIFYSNLNI